MIGRVIFAWFQGTNLDCNSKVENNFFHVSYDQMWRLLADILNDVGMTLELLSPIFPQFFLFVACLGSLAKAIVGVAGNFAAVAQLT
jgi:hypothetical protein